MLHSPLSPGDYKSQAANGASLPPTPTSSLQYTYIPPTVCDSIVDMGVFCDTSVFTAFSLQRSPSFCADVSGGGSPVAGPSRQGPSAPPIFAPRPPVFSRPSPPPIDTSCAQSQPLERVPTEPVDTPVPEKPQQPTPEELLRDHGIKVRDFAFEASALPPVPVVRRPPSQSQSQSQLQLAGSSQPPLLSASQADSEMDDEEYVKTPLVTPNGSLVYSDPVVDASTLPESQVAPLLAASQQPADEDVSVSQMGLGLSEEQAESQPAWQLTIAVAIAMPGRRRWRCPDASRTHYAHAASCLQLKRALVAEALSSIPKCPALPVSLVIFHWQARLLELAFSGPARLLHVPTFPALPGDCAQAPEPEPEPQCSRSGTAPPAADATRSVPPPPPAPHTSPVAACGVQAARAQPAQGGGGRGAGDGGDVAHGGACEEQRQGEGARRCGGGGGD
ncbi:hypothetical protein DFH11DRAFT_1874760 [Phellopilus nigrolimitatus]|nr:hypothetical protein DFH11DRAFT_1874760 [Phellopilus nigrolimitatus]